MEVLLIERACERLQIAYVRCVDGDVAAEAGGLFTDDGVFTLPDGRRAEGQAAVIAALQVRQDQDRRSRHLITNQWIDVIDEDTATGSCYWTVYNFDGWVGPRPMPLSEPMAVGQYIDEFRREESGWRITSRTLSVDFHVDVRDPNDTRT